MATEPLYPNLGYGDQPPPYQSQWRPPKFLDEPIPPKPPLQPQGPSNIHSGDPLSQMVTALNTVPEAQPPSNVTYSLGYPHTPHQTTMPDLGSALKAQRNMQDILNLPTTLHGKGSMLDGPPMHLAGELLPMPGVSPNRVPISQESRSSAMWGRDIAPYLAGSNVLRFPLRPDPADLTNIYQQNPMQFK